MREGLFSGLFNRHKSKEDYSSAKEINFGIRGSSILFDGYYRQKEIDAFFSINPQSKIGTHIAYQRQIADGRPYNASAAILDESKVEPSYESLQINNLLVAFHIKQNYFTVLTKSTHVNMTISECVESVDKSLSCFEIDLDGLPVYHTDATTGEKIEQKTVFPGKMRFRLQMGNLNEYLGNI